MFTPGPWKIDGVYHEGDGAAGYGIVSDDRFICFVSEWSERGEPSKPQSQDLINARLIKAAPEMFELLETCIPSLCDPGTKIRVRKLLAEIRGDNS